MDHFLMISHSPVNWERQGEQWNVNFVWSALLCHSLRPCGGCFGNSLSCVLVARHSKLAFSNLSNPELMSLSRGARGIYLTLLLSIMAVAGFVGSEWS